MNKIFKNLNYEKYYKGLVPYLKKDKNQQYFTVILTLTTSIIFLLFAISPTLSTIARLNKEVSDNEFVDSKLSLKISNLSTLSQSYQEIQKDIPYVLDAVPKKAEVPTLIAQIQSIAKDSSVSLSDISVSPIDLTSNVATISSFFNFDLTAATSYENLQPFLLSLTSMQRSLSIDSISVTRVEGVEGLQLNIKGSVPYKR